MTRWAWALVLVAGCYTAPSGTRRMNEQEIVVAELVADYFEVPENCRDYESVGIYQALTQQDFYNATNVGFGGFCARELPGDCEDHGHRYYARTIFTVNPPWRSLTVLDAQWNGEREEWEGIPTAGFGHEMLHVFRGCLYGADQGHTPEFEEIEICLTDLAVAGELPPRMTYQEK